MDRWTEIELFVHVAETGSLSRAALAMALSNCAASRHLSALESRLGARLVERNTRRQYLTDTGQEFFSRAKSVLADLKDAESTGNAMALNPSGVLRITASLSPSKACWTPTMARFCGWPRWTAWASWCSRRTSCMTTSRRDDWYPCLMTGTCRA